MIFPTLFYMMLVDIYSPTARMRFYQCPMQGHVVDFNETDKEDELQYLVRFECPRKKTITEWIYHSNVRKAEGGK